MARKGSSKMISTRRIGEVVYDYKTAQQYLGDSFVKQLCNATYLVKRDTHIEVTLFGNTIIRYYPDHMTITDCGWPTKTTTQRLHAMTPQYVRVNRHNGYTVVTTKDHSCIIPSEGMVIEYV